MNTNERVADYNLSMAHGDMSAMLQELVILDKELTKIYAKMPGLFEHLDICQMIEARMIIRINRAQEFLRQELQSIPK